MRLRDLVCPDCHCGGEAANAEEACARAIKLANEPEAWRSLDACDPTSVDALAEGADVDPWRASGSAHPVPPRFTDQAVALRAVLEGLLDWAAAMGGWDSPVWREAERLAGRGA